MIELLGETEFLTRVLAKHGTPHQQKNILALQIAEANDETLHRAVTRMVWLMGGVLLVYWAGSAVAFSLPGVVLTLSGKILSVLFLASAASFLAFSAYRVRIRQQLRREIEKCRDMLESALDLTANFNAALLLQQHETHALYCPRCQCELLSSPDLATGNRLLAVPSDNPLPRQTQTTALSQTSRVQI